MQIFSKTINCLNHNAMVMIIIFGFCQIISAVSPQQQSSNAALFKKTPPFPHVNFNQVFNHIEEIPETNDGQYSIVHTLIYPNKQSPKFVSSLPNDNFVKKLEQKHQKQKFADLNEKKQDPAPQQKPLSQKKQYSKQSTSSFPKPLPHIPIKQSNFAFINQIKQSNSQGKQYSIVTEQIFPKKNDEKIQPDRFVKKMQEKQKITQKQRQQKVKIQIKQKQQKEQQQKAEDILKREQAEQAEQQKHAQAEQADNKNPVKPAQKQNQGKNDGLIQQLQKQKQRQAHPQQKEINKQIKFKEHQINSPKQITNYPFQQEFNAYNEKTKPAVKPIEPPTIVPDISKENQNKNRQNKLTKQNKEIKSEQSQKQKNTKKQEQTVKKQEHKKPVIVVPKEQVKKQQKEQLRKQDSLNKDNQTKSTEKSMTADQISQRYQQLKSILSTPKDQIKKKIQRQKTVEQKIKEYDWKLLLTKGIVWSFILFAILRFTCSQVNKQNYIQKGKYTPIGGNTGIQTQDNLQDGEGSGGQSQQKELQKE